MKKVYGDDCLCRSRIHEWFKRFQEGWEALEDDESSGRPVNVVNEPHEKDLRIFDYLIHNRIVTINHSLYSPDMAPSDFYLFGKLHLAMKGKRYADVDAIQKASTAILNAIPKDDLKSHSIISLIVQIVVFSAKGTVSKATNKMLAKENQFFAFFYKVLGLFTNSK